MLKPFENRLNISCHFLLCKLLGVNVTELKTSSVKVGDKYVAWNLN
jgi:hypothetical protein